MATTPCPTRAVPQAPLSVSRLVSVLLSSCLRPALVFSPHICRPRMGVSLSAPDGHPDRYIRYKSSAYPGAGPAGVGGMRGGKGAKWRGGVRGEGEEWRVREGRRGRGGAEDERVSEKKRMKEERSHSEYRQPLILRTDAGGGAGYQHHSDKQEATKMFNVMEQTKKLGDIEGIKSSDTLHAANDKNVREVRDENSRLAPAAIYTSGRTPGAVLVQNQSIPQVPKADTVHGERYQAPHGTSRSSAHAFHELVRADGASTARSNCKEDASSLLSQAPTELEDDELALRDVAGLSEHPHQTVPSANCAGKRLNDKERGGAVRKTHERGGDHAERSSCAHKITCDDARNTEKLDNRTLRVRSTSSSKQYRKGQDLRRKADTVDAEEEEEACKKRKAGEEQNAQSKKQKTTKEGGEKESKAKGKTVKAICALCSTARPVALVSLKDRWGFRCSEVGEKCNVRCLWGNCRKVMELTEEEVESFERFDGLIRHHYLQCKHQAKGLANEGGSIKEISPAILARRMISISMRLPFSAVRNTGEDIWVQFAEECMDCQTPQAFAQQLLRLRNQIKPCHLRKAWLQQEADVFLRELQLCMEFVDVASLIHRLDTGAIDWGRVDLSFRMENAAETLVSVRHLIASRKKNGKAEVGMEEKEEDSRVKKVAKESTSK
eukprot:749232-Hanusia_phi.AAC.2